MNCNELIYTSRRIRNKFVRSRGAKAVNIQRPVIGHTYKTTNKSKTNTNAVSSNSSIRWKNYTSSNNNVTFSATRSTSSKTFTSDADTRIIIAVAAGRGEATCEIGLAAIDIHQPTLILCQISDMPSYINTLTKINILNPDEILVPMTFVNSTNSNHLVNKIKEHFKNITITAVPRLTYNKINGMQYIKELCAPEWDSIFLILQHKFYCLTAASALLTYAESVLYVIYNKKSLKIEYQESEGYCIIDVSTADKLELVACNSVSSNEKYSSLYGILNYCLTKIGTRTLRATILQPPCSVPDIEARLDCITELKRNPNIMMAVQTILPKISNIDQLLSLATLSSEQENNFTDRHITYVLTLNSFLYLVEPLKEVFENSKLSFFKELKTTLDNDSFRELTEIMHCMIQPDAHPAKGQRAINEKCFIIKPGINGLLDILRKTYSERVEDLKEYVKQLGEKYDLPLTLGNNHKKGYHITLQLNTYTKKTFKKSELPAEFIQVERLLSSVTMKTPALMNLSIRINDILLEILRVTNIMIYQILIEVRNRIGLFYKLCEDIAKLDMIQSLAQASSGIGYIRPEFGDFLEIMNSRHPLLDYLCSSEPTPNSIFASREHNVHIITGPNGAGKSIFIRQILLLQVMAQVGCFIPAEKARFRVCDRILARIYFEDNMDCGASTFVLEIKEVQYFHTVITSNTLIIIDELCRSTAVGEGTPLAMAMIESLAESQAFIFLATHFIFITELEEFYPNVTNWQMETIKERKSTRTVLRFTYNLEPGITTFKKYGLFAATASWPAYIVEEAKRLYNQIELPKEHAEIRGLHMADRLKYNCEAQLKMLKMKKELTWEVLRDRIFQYVTNLKSTGIDVTEYLPKEFTQNYELERLSEVNINGHPNTSNDEQEVEMNDWENVEPCHLYPEVVYSPSVVNSKLNLQDEITDYNQFCQELERKKAEYSQYNEIGQEDHTIFENCLPREDARTDSYVDNVDYIITQPSISQTNCNQFYEDLHSRDVDHLQYNEAVQENHTTFEHGLPFENCESLAYIDDDNDSAMRSIISQNINRIIETNRINRNGQSQYFGHTPTLFQHYQNEDYQTSNFIPLQSKSLGNSLRFLNRPQLNNDSEQSKIATENSPIWKTLDDSKNIEDPDVTAALEDLKECSTCFTEEWYDDVNSNILTRNQNPKLVEIDETSSKMILSKNPDGTPVRRRGDKANVIIHSVHIFNQNSELVGIQEFDPDQKKKLEDYTKGNEFFFKDNENFVQKKISPLFGNAFQTHMETDTFLKEKNDEKLDSSNSNTICKGQCIMSFSGNHSEILMRSNSLLSADDNSNNVKTGTPTQFNLKSDTPSQNSFEIQGKEKGSSKNCFKNEGALHKVTESFTRKKPLCVSYNFFNIKMKNDLSKVARDIPRPINEDDCEASNKKESIARDLEYSEPVAKDNSRFSTMDNAKNTQKNQEVRSSKEEYMERFPNHNESVSKSNSFFSITNTVENPAYLAKIPNQKILAIDDDNCGTSSKKEYTAKILTGSELTSRESSWFSVVDNEEIAENNKIEEVDSKEIPEIQLDVNKIESDENKTSIGCELTDFLTQKKTSISKVNLWFSSCNRQNLEFDSRLGNVQIRPSCTNDDQIRDRSCEYSENIRTTNSTIDKYKEDTSMGSDLQISEDNSSSSNVNNLKNTEGRPSSKTIQEFHLKTPAQSKKSVENRFSEDTREKIEDFNNKNAFAISTQNKIPISKTGKKNNLKLNKSLKNNDRIQKGSLISENNESIKRTGGTQENYAKCNDKNTTQNKSPISKDRTKIDLNSNKREFFKNEEDKLRNENNKDFKNVDCIEASNAKLNNTVNSTCSTTKLDFKNAKVNMESSVGDKELNSNDAISKKIINNDLEQEISVREVDSSVSTLLLNNSLNQLQCSVDSNTAQRLQDDSKPKQYTAKSIHRYFEKDITQNCSRNMEIEREFASTERGKIIYVSNANTSKSTNIFETSYKSESLFGSSSEENIGQTKPLKENVRKRKFKTPLKSKENQNASGGSGKKLKITKHKIVTEEKFKKQLRVKKTVKFIPPKILTKKEILKDYEKQTKKILENPDDPGNIDKYINFITNRPSVEQLRAQKYLALLKKTDDGVVIIPASNPEVKCKKVVPLMRKLSATEFDTTLFSDKNSKELESFLQQEDKIDFGKEKSRNLFNLGSNSKQDNFQPDATSIFQKVHIPLDGKPNTLNFNESNINFCTPDGYYKQNKSLIDNILKKYQ